MEQQKAFALHTIHNIYVYKSEVPGHLWNILQKLCEQGGPSAFERSGIFGERGDADEFPPRS